MPAYGAIKSIEIEIICIDVLSLPNARTLSLPLKVLKWRSTIRINSRIIIIEERAINKVSSIAAFMKIKTITPFFSLFESSF